MPCRKQDRPSWPANSSIQHQRTGTVSVGVSSSMQLRNGLQFGELGAQWQPLLKAGVAGPGQLQVLARAGATTGGVVQLHFPMGAAWPSSGDEETWNNKHLSDNSKHEALQITLIVQY